jgi:hypothetical protein
MLKPVRKVLNKKMVIYLAIFGDEGHFSISINRVTSDVLYHEHVCDMWLNGSCWIAY